MNELPGHPLAQKLRAVYANRNETAAELRATLEMVQLDVEKLWDVQYRSVPGDKSRFQQPGCNYRRYPASRFCMYHVTGKDALAAQLRGVEARKGAHRPVIGK